MANNLPSFKEFLKSRGKGGTKKGVNLLAALKKAKMAKKEGKEKPSSEAKESKAEQQAEKKAGVEE